MRKFFLTATLLAMTIVAIQGQAYQNPIDSVSSILTVDKPENSEESEVDEPSGFYVKVEDPSSGKKYWLEYKTNEDILTLKEKGFAILRTRVKRGKAGDKVLENIFNALGKFFDAFGGWVIEQLFPENQEESPPKEDDT